jgi:mitochondrial ATPase complex subunit ATP10
MRAVSTRYVALLQPNALLARHGVFQASLPLRLAVGSYRSRSDKAAREPSTPETAVQASAPAVLPDSKGKAADTSKVVKNNDPLPYLPRPLGVKDRPSLVSLSWQERMMDQDARMEERKVMYVHHSFYRTVSLEKNLSMSV